jgi:hypothetical protein
MQPDVVGAVQEKVNEYRFLVAPVEQAIREMQLAQGMLRARAEEEINALSPALAVLSEALGVSTLDILLASDREAFLQQAVLQSGLTVAEVRNRMLVAGVGAGEQLKALGLPGAA